MTSTKKLKNKDINLAATVKANFEKNGWTLAAYCRHVAVDKGYASRALRGKDTGKSALSLKQQLIDASKQPKPTE